MQGPINVALTATNFSDESMQILDVKISWGYVGNPCLGSGRYGSAEMQLVCEA